MNWLDNIFIIIIWLFVVFGYSKGFIAEMFAFLCWFLSAIIALFFLGGLANLITALISLNDLRFGVAFVILFAIGFVIISWLNDLIISSIGPTKLTDLECIIGAFFGFFKGGTIIITLLILLGLTKSSASLWWQESLLISFIKPIITIIFSYLSPDIVAQFNFEP
jgi:uncharacterized membrane protein required for colicin V production